jgi:hypothetical protein
VRHFYETPCIRCIKFSGQRTTSVVKYAAKHIPPPTKLVPLSSIVVGISSHQRFRFVRVPSISITSQNCCNAASSQGRIVKTVTFLHQNMEGQDLPALFRGSDGLCQRDFSSWQFPNK